jgi:hypothetical protein
VASGAAQRHRLASLNTSAGPAIERVDAALTAGQSREPWTEAQPLLAHRHRRVMVASGTVEVDQRRPSDSATTVTPTGVVEGFVMGTGSAPRNVVLVHGSFVDGSTWRAVYDLLTRDGYHVAVVQNPTLSLQGDAAATRLIVDA